MKQYRITNQVNGADLGVWVAFDSLDAQERLYASIGYGSLSYDDLLSDSANLRIEEVK